MSWKPLAKPGVDVRSLELDPLQVVLLSSLDGTADVAALAARFGVPPERIEAVLAGLVERGAVPAAAEAEAPPVDAGDDKPEAANDKPEAADNGTHRKLYELALHPLQADDRVARARAAVEPELSAYCFDPLPSVIHAVLENPRVGLGQARLIARHHRTPAGLEALAARAAFAADLAVRWGLLRNPQLPTGLFRRLWQGRRLLEQFKAMTSREVPEQTRRSARELLRSRFTSSPAEERVELIVKTEGRCLQALVGLPVDGKTTALLCARSYASTLLVQNIARWGAAPPLLIAHLLKQDLVLRNPMLRTLLDRHPNARGGR